MAVLDPSSIVSQADFLDQLRSSVVQPPVTPFHFLIGSGFSVSAGIPTARGVATILAHRKLLQHKKTEPVPEISDILLDYFSQNLSEDSVLDEYQRVFGDKTEYGLLYQKFFSDRKLFPKKAVSRREFIDVLVSFAARQSFGFNFESIFLAYLCDISSHGNVRLDTILTTNFDDVLSTSFWRINAPHRVLDHPKVIDAEEVSTKYPRIVHLHGRYLQYDLINTPQQIEKTKGGSPRGQAIRSILKKLPAESGLIVIGYAGWDDAIMQVLHEALEEERFGSGILWCHRGPSNNVSEGLARLAGSSDQVSVVCDITAFDAMRLIAESFGSTETAIIERVKNSYYSTRKSFEGRWVEIEQQLLARDVLNGMEVPIKRRKSPRPPFTEDALAKAESAMINSRLAPIAMALIETTLRESRSLTIEQQALLYQARGDLRRRYSQNIDGAITDYYWALRLKTRKVLEAKLGLAEAYSSLGQVDVAIPLLAQTREIAKAKGDSLALAKCDAIEAVVLYYSNKLAEALDLLKRAILVFEREGDQDWFARCHINASNIQLFANRLEEAASHLMVVPKGIGSDPLAYWMAGAEFAQSQYLLAKDQVSQAKHRLIQAKTFAEEGPQFALLSHISHFLADCYLREGDVRQAIIHAKEARQFYGLAGRLQDQANAHAWCMIHRALSNEALSQDYPDEAVRALEDLDQFDDSAVSAQSWAMLAFACLLGKFSIETNGLYKRALEKSEEFVEKLDKSTKKTNDRKPSIDEEVLAHRRHYVLLARIISSFIHPDGDNPGQSVSADYAALQKSVERHGWGPEPLSVIHAIAAHLIAKAKVMSEAKLLPFEAGVGAKNFSKEALRTFCEAKKYSILCEVICVV